MGTIQVKVIGLEKFVQALLEMRTSKQCELKLMVEKNLVAKNFDFFKISDESYHSNSDSKFYYPGKLSNGVLLQLPAYFKSTER